MTAPAVSVNGASLNMHVEHSILGYQPAKGPSVDITLSYNSDATGSYSYTTSLPSVGRKWNFNYASNAFSNSFDTPVNTPGSLIDVQMPDGSVSRYHWVGPYGQYEGEKGDLTKLWCSGLNQYRLEFLDGSKWYYSADWAEGAILQSMEDVWGGKLTLVYENRFNDLRRIGHIVDADGNSTTFGYGVAGGRRVLTSITDPFNRQAILSYDANANLIQVRDRAGRIFKYTYNNTFSDIIGLETPKVNPTDNNWSFNRQDSYGPVTVTNPLGGTKEYAGSGVMWITTPENYRGPNANSNSTTYFFALNVDGERVPKEVRFSDGTFVAYEYETVHGFVKKATDRQGGITSYTYYAHGQLDTVTNPKGYLTSYSYAPNGVDRTGVFQPNSTDVNAPNVRVIDVTYRWDHQPEAISNVGGTTRFTYTDWGALDTVTDPQNRATRNRYYSNGRLMDTQYSDVPVNNARTWATVKQFAYDGKGRMQDVTEADGLKTSYEYNDLDQVTAITHPDPDPNRQREEITYLNGDLPVVVKSRDGRRSYTDYDALQRPTQSYVYDAQNNASVGTTQISYDKNGNQKSLTDTNSNVTQWNYDALDRVTRKQYHNGIAEIYAYGYGNFSQPNGRGRLVQTTGTRGQIIKFEYDANGNQTKIDYPNTPDVISSYNALDDVSQITDGVGTHNFSYDLFGRQTAEDGPLVNDTQTYSYDALQRIETQTVERGISGGVQSQTYGYDALGRLARLNSNGTQGTGLTTYSYDGNTERLYELNHPNGTKTRQQYDTIGRLQYVFNGANGDTFYNRYAYQYDSRDVKTVMQTRTGPGSIPIQTVYYSYDALDQLSQESVNGGVAGTAYTANYNYDAMGNRTQMTRNSANGNSTVTSTPNTLNQLTSLTTSSSSTPTKTSNLSYDTAGNLTLAASPDGRTTYSYDDADRLVKIERRTATGAPQGFSDFVYDYASRKAISREWNYQNGAFVKTDEKRRVFDGLDVVQERNSANEVTAQLVRDGNIGGILSRTTADGAAFYGYDGNGNVTLLTNGAGQDVAHYRYDAFGQTLEAVGPRAGENPYRFSTKEVHAASGLYDFGYRFYSPGMGRWINRDPLGEDGGVNLYAMVGNSPVNDVDEYGELPHFGGPVEFDPGGGGDLDYILGNIEREEREKQRPLELSEFDKMMAKRMEGVNPWGDAAPLGGPMSGMGAVRVPAQKPRIPRAPGGVGTGVGKGIVTSAIERNPYAKRLARGLTGVVQRDVDSLVANLLKGNLNPGIGTRALGNGFFELRGGNAGRVVIKSLGNKRYDIVGKFQGHARGDAANSAIIKNLMGGYRSR